MLAIWPPTSFSVTLDASKVIEVGELLVFKTSKLMSNGNVLFSFWRKTVLYSEELSPEKTVFNWYIPGSRSSGEL